MRDQDSLTSPENRGKNHCIIKFRKEDNVGIALANLEAGQSYTLLTCEGERLRSLRIPAEQPHWSSYLSSRVAIPFYHKVATDSIPRNASIIKDGVPIGLASEEIISGQLVHQRIENAGGRIVRRGGNISEHANIYSPPPEKMETLAAAYSVYREGFDRAPALRAEECEAADIPPLASVYLRAGGELGVRCHILVIPSVFCVNQEAVEIAEPFRDAVWGENGENYVHAVAHSSGCCQTGFDEEASLRTLSNIACRPNVGGVLIVTLGCSPFCVNDRLYQAVQAKVKDTWVHCVRVQEEGLEAAIRTGRARVKEMIASLRTRKREMASLSGLSLAVKCGASDPTSGLFANTAIGHMADWLLDRKGTVVVSEIMEYFGPERILNERCRDHGVWLDLLRVIKSKEMIGKAAAVAAEEDLHSVELTLGNMRAGLSTQEDKSLGAIRKMGFRHPIENVVRFGERITGNHRGLYVMDGPGQDLLSASGMGATGAQVMLFSTGIGTPLGNAVTPVIKITGNEDTSRCHQDFIDLFIRFDRMLAQGISAEEITLQTLLPELIAVVEGRRTKAEMNRHRDFAIRNYAMVQ
jgi:altronate dehydratase large subunit